MLRTKSLSISEIIERRKIQSFYQLEENIQDTICQFVLDYKPKEVQLGGSFIKGYWYLGNNERIREFRKDVYNKNHISDIDLYTELNIMDYIEDYDYNIDLKPISVAGRDKKLLIYKNDDYR